MVKQKEGLLIFVETTATVGNVTSKGIKDAGLCYLDTGRQGGKKKKRGNEGLGGPRGSCPKPKHFPPVDEVETPTVGRKHRGFIQLPKEESPKTDVEQRLCWDAARIRKMRLMGKVTS